MRMQRDRGFTLIELMIVAAIIAVLAAIALPLYQNYIQTAQESVLSHNISTMRVFQEDFRLRTGAYSDEDWTPGDGPTNTGWQPNQDGATVTYVVTVDAGPPPSYTVTATDASSGVTLTRTFP